MTLIALCGLTLDDAWSSAKQRRCTITKDIMDYLAKHYGKKYAPNTRETFRRQVLHQFVQGRIADRNPFAPGLSTNSPKTHYAVTEAMLDVVRHYGTDAWPQAVESFQRKQPALAERHAHDRVRNLIPVRLPDGQELQLSPGRHNAVQRDVVESFMPQFAPGASLLYLGDTAKKNLFVDEAGLAELGITITAHDKLPDVMFYDAKKNLLFFVEAVTSHGPVSPTRLVDLKAMLTACRADPVYVSAFPDLDEFRKHMRNIAWETKVWLCDMPDNMIHYNGGRFLGPTPRE